MRQVSIKRYTKVKLLFHTTSYSRVTQHFLGISMLWRVGRGHWEIVKETS